MPYIILYRDTKQSIILAKHMSATKAFDSTPKRYVVAVNESLTSKRSLQAAARLAKPCDVICVFHVVDCHRILTEAEEAEFQSLMKRHNDKQARKIPPVKSGTFSYTASVINRQEAGKSEQFMRIIALRRANEIVRKYKQYGYNVMVVDVDETADEGMENAHPLVLLGHKIAVAARDFEPTYVVMGAGSYTAHTVDQYYGKPNPGASTSDAVSPDPDVNNVLFTVTEIVADHEATNTSLIAVTNTYH